MCRRVRTYSYNFLGFGFHSGVGFMLGFGFQAWLLGLKPMGFGFRPPPVHGAGDGSPGGCAARSRVGVAEGVWRELCVCACEREVCLGCVRVLLFCV